MESSQVKQPLTFSVDGIWVLVRLGSLHCQFPLDSGQNFAILIQYSVPGVGSFFKLWVALILAAKMKKKKIGLVILRDSSILFLYNYVVAKFETLKLI